MYCVMVPVAAVSAGALTFLVLSINEIVLYCILLLLVLGSLKFLSASIEHEKNSES